MPEENIQSKIEQRFNDAALHYSQKGSSSLSEDTGISEKDADSFVKYNVALTDDAATMRKERAQNQTWGEQALHGMERFGRKTLLTAAQQMASMSEFGSHFTEEGMDVSEAGNSFYNYLDEWKKEIDEETEIFQVNEGESFDFGDSAWWISNISSGAESAAAFLINSAITGQVLGTMFTAAARASTIGRIYGAKKTSEAVRSLISASKGQKGLASIANSTKGKSAWDVASRVFRQGAIGEKARGRANALAQLGTATIGNHMEGFGVALETAKKARENALAEGKSSKEADKIAGTAAATAYNWNMANIALNISGASAFVNGAKGTRKLLSERSLKKSLINLVGEGVQEGVEEGVNFAAEKAGLAAAKEKQYSVTQGIIDTMGSSEGRESMFWGAAMGVGQTAGGKGFEYLPTKKDKDGNRTSKANLEKESYINQQKNIQKNKEFAEKNGLDIESYMNSGETAEELSKAYQSMQEAINDGDEMGKDLHRNQALAVSAHHNFKNGTTESFIQALEEQKKNIAKDEEKSSEQKAEEMLEISKAIHLTNRLEAEYNNSTKYLNQEQVYQNKANQIILEEVFEKGKKELEPLNTDVLVNTGRFNGAEENLKNKKADALADLQGIDIQHTRTKIDTQDSLSSGVTINSSEMIADGAPVTVKVGSDGRVDTSEYTSRDIDHKDFIEATKAAEEAALKALDDSNFKEEIEALEKAEKELNESKAIYKEKKDALSYDVFEKQISSFKEAEMIFKSNEMQNNILDKIEKEKKEDAERKRKEEIDNSKKKAKKKKSENTKSSEVTGSGDQSIDEQDGDTEESIEEKRNKFLEANKEAIPPEAFDKNGNVTNTIKGVPAEVIKKMSKTDEAKKLVDKYGITPDQAAAYLQEKIRNVLALSNLGIQNNLSESGSFSFTESGEVRQGVHSMDNKLAIRFVNEDGSLNPDLDTDIYKLKEGQSVEFVPTTFKGEEAIQVKIDGKEMGYMHTVSSLLEAIKDGRVQGDFISYTAQLNNLKDTWVAVKHAKENNYENIKTTVENIYDGTIEQHKKNPGENDVFKPVNESNFGEGEFVIQRNDELQVAKDGKLITMDDVVNSDSIKKNGYQGAVFYLVKKKPWDPDSKEMVAIPVKSKPIRENESVSESINAIVDDWSNKSKDEDEAMLSKLSEYVHVLKVKDAQEFSELLENIPPGITVIGSDVYNGASLFIGSGVMNTGYDPEVKYVKQKSNYKSGTNSEKSFQEAMAGFKSILGNVNISFKARKKDNFSTYSLDESGNLVEKKEGSYTEFLRKNMRTKYRGVTVPISNNKGEKVNYPVPSVSHVITFDRKQMKSHPSYSEGAERQKEATERVKNNPNVKRTLNEDGTYTVTDNKNNTFKTVRQSKLKKIISIFSNEKGKDSGEQAISVGNVIDEVLNNAVEGKSISSAVEKGNKKTKNSGGVYQVEVDSSVTDKLAEKMANIKKELNDLGYEVHAKDMFVAAQFTDDNELKKYLEANKYIESGQDIDGVAGSLDLVVIKDGVIHILDFKTVSDITTLRGKLNGYAEQQKIYKILAEKNGYTVGTVGIIPIAVDYSKDGNTVTLKEANMVDLAEKQNNFLLGNNASMSMVTTNAIDLTNYGDTTTTKSKGKVPSEMKNKLDKLNSGLKRTYLDEVTNEKNDNISDTYSEEDFNKEFSDEATREQMITKALDDYNNNPTSQQSPYDIERMDYLKKYKEALVNQAEENLEDFEKSLVEEIKKSLKEANVKIDLDAEFSDFSTSSLADFLTDFIENNRTSLSAMTKSGQTLEDAIGEIIDVLYDLDENNAAVTQQELLENIPSKLECH
jgi:hypothetical protein